MKYGAFSEIGKLRKVMVCRPGLAHQRLTPGNCQELLFDDVIWIQEAQSEHRDFVAHMEARGIEVLEMHDLLAKTLKDKKARAWVLDRRITENKVGIGMLADIRAWLDEMPAMKLAEHLIGGIARAELPFKPHRHDGTLSRADRLRDPAGAELVVHAGYHLLDRERCDAQSAVSGRHGATRRC